MTFATAAVIAGIGSVAVGAYGAYNANKAANAQVGAANDATGLQRDIYNKNIELQKPFYEGGVSAENRMLDLLGLSGNKSDPEYGSLNRPFTYSELLRDPGYNFRFTEGLRAVDRSAAAKGGLISGGALKAATRYGQEAGSQEYQNAFNRYQVNRANVLNPLQSLTGAGQTSANVMGAEGGTYATNAGNNMIGAGNARASGYTGGANAINSGIGQYLNNQNQMAWLNAFTGNRGGVTNLDNMGWGYGSGGGAP